MSSQIDWGAAPQAIRGFVDWLEHRGARLSSRRQSSALNLVAIYELADLFLVSILADRGRWFVEVGSASDAARDVFGADLWNAFFGGEPASIEPLVRDADEQVAFFASMIENVDNVDWVTALPALRLLRRQRVEKRLGFTLP